MFSADDEGAENRQGGLLRMPGQGLVSGPHVVPLPREGRELGRGDGT